MPDLVERLESRRVLVTGASGLLGAGVARVLADADNDVTTLQRRPSGVPGARDVRGSVTDPAAVEDVIWGCVTQAGEQTADIAAETAAARAAR